MSADQTPRPFRYVDAARIRREYWALARRVHDGLHPSAFPTGARRQRTGAATSAGGAPVRPAGHSSGSMLADEVAIDFPSMTPIVARMRAAFFAETGDRDRATRRAEVELTARQADQGVRVPLDLTLQHTCPACGGRGESWTDRCGLCAGSGAGFLPHRLHFRVPPGVRHGTRLRYSVTPPHAFETHIEVRIAVQ